MRVLVSGSHGLIGSALVADLAHRGHDVVRLVRDGATGAQAIHWDPANGHLDPRDLVGIEAVIHLAGAGIGDHRWSSAQLGRILDSRVQGTALLAGAISSLDDPPGVLISGSAVGFYGDGGDEPMTEQDGPGAGFLAEVCQQWEASTSAAEHAGIRVVHSRTGVVLSSSGGALGKQLRLFRLGVGGRLGTGEQYLSWVSIDDVVGALEFALREESLSGAMNLTAPEPVTNREFTKELGRALHRPTVMAVPESVLRLVLGRQMANEMILSGQRVLPARLQAAGFTFIHATLAGALAHVLGG